jgi:cytochrome c
LLRHQRDRTVRDGVRGARVSLAACVECHAGKGAGVAAGSVVGSPEAFCESCHRYAAVKLDCFECHRSRPEGALAATSTR